MFAPGIASPARARAGRQWPAVRIFFLKKSLPPTGRPGDDSDTSQNETHLRTKRNANAECQRNDEMMELEPRITRMTRMHLRMTNDGMTNVEGMTKWRSPNHGLHGYSPCRRFAVSPFRRF